MGTQRKTYAQLDAEIQALIKKREEVLEGSADILSKAILTKEVKNKIAMEPTDVVKAAGKKIAASIDKYIDEAKKQADDKDALRPESAKNVPKKETVTYKFDVPSAAKKPAADARPSGAPSPVTGAGNLHQD